MAVSASAYGHLMMLEIACVGTAFWWWAGRALISMLIRQGTEIETTQKAFQAALGGSAANIAVAIGARQGGSCSLLTAVSDDAVGRYTVKCALLDYGVDTSPCLKIVGGEARNSLAVVETRAENCQSVIYQQWRCRF